jgi:hypothetical protein
VQEQPLPSGRVCCVRLIHYLFAAVDRVSCFIIHCPPHGTLQAWLGMIEIPTSRLSGTHCRIQAHKYGGTFPCCAVIILQSPFVGLHCWISNSQVPGNWVHGMFYAGLHVYKMTWTAERVPKFPAVFPGQPTSHDSDRSESQTGRVSPACFRPCP